LGYARLGPTTGIFGRMKKGPNAELPRPPEAAVEALYGAPLSEFVDLRARLAAELRAGGEKDIANAVLALRKPNAAAWGLNQLARREPGSLTALFEARGNAERAQGDGDVAKLRAAIVEYRAKLDRLVGWVETRLREAGSSATKESARGVRRALEAASLDPKGAGAELAAARLVQAPDADESDTTRAMLSETAGAHVPLPPLPPRPLEAPVKEESVVDLAARRLQAQALRRLVEATSALEAAEAHEAAARAQLESAEQGLAAATRAVGAARAMVDAAKRAIAEMGKRAV
jgi:hypothetical protein